jgi:DNA-binding NtrC family response regulator
MLADGAQVTEDDVRAALPPVGAAGPTRSGRDLGARPERVGEPPRSPVTREQIEEAIQQVGNNRSALARCLGISRRTLYRRLDRLSLR